ncbi:MAG: HEAT repeat domain-containing protein [Planctomycetes bacterium]|nr:HEAT repeat domain-containing protein [Planctomycetota bacterium]
MRRPGFAAAASLSLAALAGLAALGGCASSVDDLVEDLGEEDAMDRLDAAVSLGELGPEAAGAAKPLEERMARDPNGLVRAACARALSRVAGGGGEQAFLRALDDKDPLVRAEAVRALGGTGAGGAADALAGLLGRDAAPEVRRACAAALGAGGALRHVEPLIDALSDRDAAVRARAEDSLRRLTCRDLGPVPDDWRAWWKGFKERMESPSR